MSHDAEATRKAFEKFLYMFGADVKTEPNVIKCFTNAFFGSNFTALQRNIAHMIFEFYDKVR